MRFSFAHKTATYLMVAASVAAALLGDELSMVTRVLALLGIVLSWWAEAPRYDATRYIWPWNIATVLFVSYLGFGVTQGAAVLESGVQFLLFILVNKLFNRRASRDYQQIYVVAFLMLVAATTLNTGISYALSFVLFVIFSTWSLTLFHLRREIEDNYLLKHQEGVASRRVEVERILGSRRIIGGRFLFGTSMLSLAVVGGAVSIFTLFPRIGFGLFATQRRHGVSMVGFSDQVKLGHHGRVRDNPKVVMRVVLDAKQRRSAAGLLWRGSVFDHYEGGEWSHGPRLRHRTMPVYPEDGLYGMNYAPGLPSHSPVRSARALFRQEIYLEPMGSRVLFAADRPVAIEVPRRKIGGRLMFHPRRGPLGEMRTKRPRSAGVRYTAYSKRYTMDKKALRQATPIGSDRWGRFLQLPANLSPRVKELALQITADKKTIYDKVMAVQRHLRRRFRYTLDLKRKTELDPVEEFLFVNRRGHCEYFATAMAILLRSVGIHSRHVNGFSGGQYNTYGKFIAVRQGDAHAWTEVLFSNVGWVTFDPTPPRSGSARKSGGIGRALRQMLDAMRMRWFRYVVEYDLSKQVAILRSLKKRFKSAESRRSAKKDAGARSTERFWLVGTLALLLAGWLAWRRYRKRQRRAGGRLGSPHPASAMYAQALRLLERANSAKPPAMTPREFSADLRLRGHPASRLVQQLTDCYYVCRFAGAAGESELSSLSSLLDALREFLRKNAANTRQES